MHDAAVHTTPTGQCTTPTGQCTDVARVCALTSICTQAPRSAARSLPIPATLPAAVLAPSIPTPTPAPTPTPTPTYPPPATTQDPTPHLQAPRGGPPVSTACMHATARAAGTGAASQADTVSNTISVHFRQRVAAGRAFDEQQTVDSVRTGGPAASTGLVQLPAQPHHSDITGGGGQSAVDDGPRPLCPSSYHLESLRPFKWPF